MKAPIEPTNEDGVTVAYDEKPGSRRQLATLGEKRRS